MSASPELDDLFAAARDDAPTDVVRDQVWGRVAAATIAPAGAAAAVKAAAVPSGGKLIAVGALIGAASAAAVALALVSLDGDAPRSTPAAGRAPAVIARGPLAGARLAEPSPRGRAEPAPEPAPAVAAHVDSERRDDASALAEEARLVTEARAALVRGEPELALALARSTHRLSARALEPEELALEARALRALGRTDEALATELTLRRRFPSHALSR
ncbi:MAG: hypothetical protein KF764_15065 [Labilithrix sp.]|nr:hypothetical protein [Labilithrix sp.]